MGESGDESIGRAIKVDSNGDAYVAVETTASGNETTGGAFQSNDPDASYSTYIAKLNPGGSAPIYATYLGGSTADVPRDIAVDAAGNLYVAGDARSTDFPITPGAFQTSNHGGKNPGDGSANWDTFVAELNATGSVLIYSTYLGGSGFDEMTGLALDAAGNAYLAGTTNSTDFPTANAIQPALHGALNGFVTELNATGTGLIYSTYLGGSGSDYAYAVAVDGSGDAYVSGFTGSPDFPTVDPLQATNAGGYDAFVAQLSPGGTALVFSTYLGGSNGDFCEGIVIDASGNIYITGDTGSTDFPTTPGAFQQTYGGGTDTFVAKIAPGSALTATGTTVAGTERVLASFLVATFTDADPNDSLVDLSATITWGDGGSSVGTVLVVPSGGYSVVGSHNYVEEGSYDVTVNISDIAGNSASDDSVVNVADAPLTATSTNLTSTADTPFNGQVATVTDGNFSSDVSDLSATIDWGDGSATSSGTFVFSTLGTSGVTYNVDGSHTYASAGSYQVAVTIADQGGSSTTTSTTMTVANVPPTVTITAPAASVPGQPQTFTFAAMDVSPTDQAAGFIYTINWGDGISVLTVPRSASNGSGVSIDYVYTAPGSFTVQATATDDRGTSRSTSQSLAVQSVEMEGNTLAVDGTLGNDTIVLSPADAKGDINVVVNNVSQGSFLPTDHILVYGQSGNDIIELASTKIHGTRYYITVPAFLYGGGTGHDVLDASGSTANNVLTGGAGTNDLYGGQGRDLLIAGLGASKLYAGLSDDILIGGTTKYDLTSSAMTYDQKLAALEAIMAEWGRTDADYLTRLHHLDGSLSGGMNGSSFLNPTTVHDNGQADTLFGAPGPALDCFFTGMTDVIRRRRSGEVVTRIA